MKKVVNNLKPAPKVFATPSTTLCTRRARDLRLHHRFGLPLRLGDAGKHHHRHRLKPAEWGNRIMASIDVIEAKSSGFPDSITRGGLSFLWSRGGALGWV